MTDFNPNAKGRGPSRLKGWYVVRTLDDPGFIAQFVWVDSHSSHRADHVLSFKPWRGPRIDVIYGRLLEVFDLEPCPKCKNPRPSLMRRDEGDWHCLECGHDQTEDPAPSKPMDAQKLQFAVQRAAKKARRHD